MAKALKEYLEIQKKKTMLKNMSRLGKTAGEYPLEFGSNIQLHTSYDMTSGGKRKGARTFLEDFPKAGQSGVNSPQAMKSQASLSSRNTVGSPHARPIIKRMGCAAISSSDHPDFKPIPKKSMRRKRYGSDSEESSSAEKKKKAADARKKMDSQLKHTKP